MQQLVKLLQWIPGASRTIDINDIILFDVDFTSDVNTTDIFGSSASLSLNE